MTALENPPENPCFGCGPRHDRGLHLGFRRERAADGAEEVVAEHTPAEDEIGWPGLFHTGLHYTVLFEASYWAAWELTDRVHTVYLEQSFDQRRLPPVGAPFTARARLVAPRDDEPLRVRAVSASAEGREFATLETAWRPMRRSLVEGAGLELPEYLLQDMAP